MGGTMKDTDKIKARLTAKRPADKPPLGLSTGSTLLNLALSGKSNYGILAGHNYLFVGASQAGKTWLSLTVMAEACQSPHFAAYRLVHDNAERGALMDIRRYFGPLADRLEPPCKRGHSITNKEFYDNVEAVAARGGPFIYVLDSEDALKPDGGEDKKGFHTEKAKANTSGLRSVHHVLEEHNSILLIIKQSRDNIGFGAQFNPQTKSGGRALTFYATAEVWFSIAGRKRADVRGNKLITGTTLKAHVKKNRIAGQDRAVEIDFYPSVGIDDVGSCVNYLIEWSHWKGTEKRVEAPEFDYGGGKEGLIELIESGDRERDLRLLVAEVWRDIEAKVKVRRKNRYGETQ